MTSSSEAKLPQFPKSYWLASTELPAFTALTEDLEVDTCIVGGGMTGIITAYLLARKGQRVAVLEAGRLLHGTTGYTTAKITAQHDLIYHEYLSHFGQEKTKLYYEANQEALQFIRQTAAELDIDCQLTEEEACIYTSSDDVSVLRKLEAEYKAYETLGIPGRFTQETPLPFATQAAVVMTGQAQFHPAAFLVPLVKEVVRMGGHFHELTTVVGVDKQSPATVKTQGGAKVHCSHVVSASHFPFNDRNGQYYARLHAERSYALAVKTERPFPGGMYLSADQPKRSLRSVQAGGEELLIIGGEGHKTGQGECTFGYYEALQRFGEEIFGLKEIAYRWSAQDLYTLDNMPYIGQELPDVPNIYLATGYRKWGMSTSVVAALLNSRLISGEGSPYTEVFTPSRFHADPDIKTFVVQNANVAGQLIAGKLELTFRDPEELQKDEGAVVRIHGLRAGAYRDEHGELHLVDTTCTHMGCEVKWNEGERTWDCPCHGSRYTYQGEVIEGPAKKALAKVQL